LSAIVLKRLLEIINVGKTVIYNKPTNPFMPTKFDKVCTSILKKYKATQKEHDIILKKIDSFIHEIRLVLQKSKIDAYVMLGGSAAKGTFVKNDFDCDVFVRFQHDKYKHKVISDILEKALKKIKGIDMERVHGSRDYFQGKWHRMDFEVIPVLYCTHPNQAKNITDMSPLHVEWLNQHIDDNLRNEILLTKTFCKAQKIYGAESYLNGFSGHVVDLITVHYGSFKKLLKATKKWEEKTTINMSQKPITEDDLNPDKVIGPMIIVDPINPHRNAAAALGYEQFYRFKNQAKAFLKSPDTLFFKRMVITKTQLKEKKKQATKKKQSMIVVKALPLHGKLDTIGTKIFKGMHHITSVLINNDFTVVEENWDWIENQDEPALLWFIIEEQELTKTKKHLGPPLELKKNVAAFKKKHKKFTIEKERVVAEVKRKYTLPLQVIRDVLKEQETKKRVRKWSVVRI
jgi:tRNA nucleotidyltransferase (CCA-adding enzyme)